MSRPGDDFRVDVVQPEVTLVQQVAPYELQFTVNGCDDFVAAVTVSGGTPKTLEPKALGNGRFTASVPVESLRPVYSYCPSDAELPQRDWVSLDVTCRQDGRVTKSHFSVKYAPAWRASYRGRGPVDAVFAGPSPDGFYQVGSGWLDVVEGKEVASDVNVATSPERQLLAAGDGVVHLWTTCPINNCGMFWFVDTPTMKSGTNADLVQVFESRDGQLRFVKNLTAPPGGIDLVREGNASVLLSRMADSTALTRISDEITVVALLEGELEPTSFGVLDGAHVFLTQTSGGRARLRRTDGSLIGEFVLPGSGTIEQVSLAPSGDAWVVIRGGQAWISTLERSTAGASASSALLATELTGLHDQTAADSAFGVAWTASGVVLRDRTGAELFSRAAPFERKWKTLAAKPNVTFAVGVGDTVVLLTSSGLQILDANGRLVGGADPIAPGCGLDYYARHLAVVAPDVVALAGKQATYQFRVSGMTTEVSR